MDSTSLIGIFLTGLFAGALTCMAVQGGLLAVTIAQRHEQRLQEQTKRTGNALPITAFLAAKLIAYTLLGLLLGWFGSLFQLSITASMLLQLAVGIFMLGTALNLLHVHPLFRYFIIQPPRFLTRLVRKESKSNSIFAPALLGAFTVFIPCGTTQAMMALAIASGNPIAGAAILAAFTLGTSPLFFTLGYITTRFGEGMQQKFTKVAAYALILFAIFNLNNAMALTGSKLTLQDLGTGLFCTVSFCDHHFASPTAQAAVSEATLTINNDGYTPSDLIVKAGSQVTLHVVNNGVGGGTCTQALAIPTLNIQKIVPVGSSDTITFTAPNEPGTQIAFMCSMGMYGGTIHVI